MQVPIQYVTTSDGVSIAYYAMGGGPGIPVVWIELPSQLQLEQKLFPAQARIYRALSRLGTLVRYDHRGFGLSDRTITDFPLDDMAKDLEAVIDKLALGPLVLLGAGGFTGLVAIAYAASHPKQVAKLVVNGRARVPPAFHERYQSLMTPGSDWRFVSEAISRLGLGWDEETSRPVAAWYRESCSHETFEKFWRDIKDWDVRRYLSRVDATTLIVAIPKEDLGTIEEAREMTSLIPHAQMVVAEGDTYDERLGSYQAAVAEFIYGPDIALPNRRVPPGPGTAIILFADIVDSTALTERLGDADFRAKARELDSTLCKVIRGHGGSCIDAKTLGDGVLATFTGAANAIEAALACGRAGDEVGLPLHLGLHAGDVIREADNVYGGAVNIAARVAAASAAGETLVSATVRELARTSARVAFEDRGEQALKGVGDPVRVWAVVNEASSRSS